MTLPPMPSMAGMASSMGPICGWKGLAPRASARRYAAAASRTRKAMAQAEGPWARAKRSPWLPGSALTMKLISPWR
jgi:hypothetical protein